MRHEHQESAEQSRSAQRLPLPLLAPDIDASLPDWREIGRHVLSESMRRAARQLRRRNGCAVCAGRLRGKWRESS